MIAIKDESSLTHGDTLTPKIMVHIQQNNEEKSTKKPHTHMQKALVIIIFHLPINNSQRAVPSANTYTHVRAHTHTHTRTHSDTKCHTTKQQTQHHTKSLKKSPVLSK